MQGRESANRGLSAHRHKDRSLDLTACETKRSSTCIAVLAVYRKWDRAGHGKQANLLATLGVLSMKLWPLQPSSGFPGLLGEPSARARFRIARPEPDLGRSSIPRRTASTWC